MFSGRREPIRLFRDRYLVSDPRVLIREELPPLDFMFRVDRQRGEFYLVVPNTAKEVFFLQMLGKNIDVFLPSEGEGLLVRVKAIDTL
jgi:hypothetical protein